MERLQAKKFQSPSVHVSVWTRNVEVSRPAWSRDHFVGLGLGLTVIDLGLGLGLMR